MIRNEINEIIDIYEDNKDKNWKEWLEYEETFDKPGKQGLVGVLKIKNTEYNCIFKISQYLNYLVEHEYSVMNSLNDISRYCPHFCQCIGKIKCILDPKCRKSGNPFNTESKYPIEKDILLLENIKNSNKFYNYIRSEKINDNVIYSIIKQVLLAISIAQKQKKFTHYDLHSFNIMIKKCDKDTVFLYILDEENQYAVCTYGYYPVIIDFGFSYIQDMDNNPLWCSLGHTNVGFMSDRFDWVADPKLFLVSVSYDISKKRNNKLGKKFNRIVKNLFSNLKIDWDSGWDNQDNYGASDYVTEKLEKYNTNISELFSKYEHYCIDIIQSLIILPLERQTYKNIGKAYTVFLKEFVKIENDIVNPFYNLYILKNIVDIARNIRSQYYNSETRNKAIIQFRQKIQEVIQKITKFCNPKNVHYEKMLCSLLILARNSEGMLYNIIKNRMKSKEKQYKKLPVHSVEQIYAIIEVNIPDTYIYNKNTIIHVIDSASKNTHEFNLNDNDIEKINECNILAKGTLLYDITKC
jgi:hypothetical protein